MSQSASSVLQQFVADQRGNIDVFGYLLIVVIVGIGALVGLVTVRDQVVQEFGDIGLSLENLNQSYSFSVNGTISKFKDNDAGDDVAGQEPAGISIEESAVDEASEDANGAEEEGS